MFSQVTGWCEQDVHDESLGVWHVFVHDAYVCVVHCSMYVGAQSLIGSLQFQCEHRAHHAMNCVNLTLTLMTHGYVIW
jgi:hypothetical protein